MKPFSLCFSFCPLGDNMVKQSSHNHHYLAEEETQQKDSGSCLRHLVNYKSGAKPSFPSAEAQILSILPD